MQKKKDYFVFYSKIFSVFNVVNLMEFSGFPMGIHRSVVLSVVCLFWVHSAGNTTHCCGQPGSIGVNHVKPVTICKRGGGGGGGGGGHGIIFGFI